MAIRLTGMNSGLDTEALVSELVSAYRIKTETYEKEQTKLEWKQDVWKSLNSKIYSFYNSISNLRYSASYKLKTTTISDSTKANITASNAAVNGSQSLNITSLAKAGYLTGGQLSTTSGLAASSATTLKELGYTSGKAEITLNGKKLQFTENSRISDVIKQMKDAGVEASFDETNQRFFVSAKDSGEANDFTLSAANTAGADALKKMGLYVQAATTDALDAKFQSYDGMSAEDLEDLLKAYDAKGKELEAGNTASKNLTKAKNYLSAKEAIASIEEKLNGTNDELAKKLLGASSATAMMVAGDVVYTKAAEKDEDGNEYYTKEGSDTKYYLKSKTTTEDGKKVTEYSLVTLGEDEKLSDVEFDENAKVKDANTYLKETLSNPEIEGNDTTESLTDADIAQYRAAQKTIKAFDEAVEKEATDGTDALDDAGLSQYSLASLKSAVDADPDYDFASQSTAIDLQNNAAKNYLNENAHLDMYVKDYLAAENDTLTEPEKEQLREAAVQALQDRIAYAIAPKEGYSDGAVRINGSDAVIYLNGAQFKSSSNTFNINGLTINATAVTTTEEKIANGTATEDAVTITTTADAQGIYDKIKDLLSEYNSIINEMTTMYNAGSSKGYEPLTDDEKSAMSEDEIEKWETKIKDSLLRRDSTLNSVLSSMTISMQKQYNIGGKNYSLASFGIQTLGYLDAEKNEHNSYHIYGDEDDDAVNDKADKLMKMINEDPDVVMEFFQNLMTDVYDNLGKKMSSTSMRSIYNVYNDKELKKQISAYDKTIADWEDKVAEMEDSYYRKFSAMETALSKLQSQQTQLAGLFGG